MAETLIFASVTLIFLLILIQKVSIRFLFCEKLLLEIDYSFFKLVLSDFDKGKSNRLSPRLYPKIKRISEFLLRKSHLSITEIKLKSRDIEPKSFILRYKNLFSLFAALSVYLSKKTEKLILNDTSLAVSTNGDEKYTLDLSLSAPLFIILIAAIEFLFTMIKNKRLTKSKRGQNV